MSSQSVLLIHPPPDLEEAVDPTDHLMRIVPSGLQFVAEHLRSSGLHAVILRLEIMAANSVEGRREVPGLGGYRDLLAEVLAIAGEVSVVGIQCHWSFYQPGALQTAALLKELRPDLFIVLGGAHASAMPQELLNAVPALDAIVVGEGELAMEALTLAAAEGPPDTTPIAGVWWRGADGSPLAPLEPAAILDRDALPQLSFDSTLLFPPNAAQYVGLPLVRGICPMRCTFCTLNNAEVYNRDNAFMDARLEEQLVRMNEVGVPLYLPENIFTADPLQSVLDIVRRRDLDRLVVFLDIHPSMLRPEMIALLTELNSLTVGVRLWIGIESADDRVRRKMGRFIDDEKLEGILNAVLSSGIQNLSASFMSGLPGEDDQAHQRTRAMVADLSSRGVHVDIYPPVAFPGTKWFDDPDSFGIDLRVQSVDDLNRLGQGWFGPLTEGMISFTTGSETPATVIERIFDLRILSRQKRDLPIPLSLFSYMMHPRRELRESDQATILDQVQKYLLGFDVLKWNDSRPERLSD